MANPSTQVKINDVKMDLQPARLPEYGGDVAFMLEMMESTYVLKAVMTTILTLTLPVLKQLGNRDRIHSRKSYLIGISEIE